MKYKIGQLGLWFYIAYLIYSPLRQVIEQRDISPFFYWTEDAYSFRLQVSVILCFFAYSLATYTVLYMTPLKKQRVLRIILLFCVIPAVIAFRYFFEEIFQRAIFGRGNYNEDVDLFYYFMDNLYYALFFPWVGGVLYFIQYAALKENQKLELEKENQKTQLSLLRAQVNPHFLFNSLNNIYSLVYMKSENSLKAIEKLSGLLRYSLYEQEKKVTIEKEAAFLEDFISLEKMRHDYEIPLELSIDEHVGHLKIIPFILITFAENAFKHGILNDPKKPIKITLFKDESHLVFETQNFIAKKEKDQIGGIGLDNIARRLALNYGEDHTIEIVEKEHHFTARLKITLNQC